MTQYITHKKGFNNLTNERNYTYNLFEDYKEVLSVKDLQSALSIGRSKAYQLINSNEIAHCRVGNSIKIPKTALLNYIELGTTDRMCYTDIRNGQANEAVRKGSSR